MDKKTAPEPANSNQTAFTFKRAASGQPTPGQREAFRECQHPVAPRGLSDEDWRYGIGLN